jgi:glycine/D-amino acid oxidase-like deaminating enzyme
MSPNPAKARKRLVEGLTSIFPQLADIAITNHWFGFVAFPFRPAAKIGGS